jgi:NDP-sugar pyrophosphorylase family protein
MQVVILAGGLGTRLSPITQKTPKVMVPIKGKPFLLHITHLLANQGIRDSVFCIGYLGDVVKDFFKKSEATKLRIRFSEDGGKLLGTGGALKHAQKLLDDCFCVINGDTFIPIDYKDLWHVFIKRGKKALMVVNRNEEDSGVKNNVALDDDLLVIGYDKEKPDHHFKYVDAGLLILRRETLDIIGDQQPISLEEGLYPSLIQQKELAAYICEQKFFDIGTPERLKIFIDFLENTYHDNYENPI